MGKAGFYRLSGTPERQATALFALLLCILGLAATAFAAAEGQDKGIGEQLQPMCLFCHTRGTTMEEMMLKTPFEEMFKHNYLTSGPAELAKPRPKDWRERLLLDKEAFLRSVHGNLNCVECHDSIKTLPHRQYLPKPNCQNCHESEEKLWNEGEHGRAFAKGDRDAPDCARCHSDYHVMRPDRSGDAELNPANTVRKCASCHADRDVLGRHKDLKGDAVETYMQTIHGRGIFQAGLMSAADCSDCHGPHRNLCDEDEKSSISLTNIARTCGHCHTTVATSFTASIHGQAMAQGGDDAPACTTCHPGHEVKQVALAQFQLGSVGVCGQCHAEQIKTYRLTYHGKVAAHGGLETARCADCHGYHDVQATTSPLSSVSGERIVATCRRCHPRANTKLAAFIPHLEYHDKSHPQTYYAWLFMTILLVGTMGFFVVHSLLWLVREIAELRRRKGEGARAGAPTYYVRRFNLAHRITHAVLFVSVIGLALTGLPLRYSQSAWAKWIMAWLGGPAVAGGLHRIFAALTIGYVAIHFGYLWNLWRRAPKRPFWKTVFGPTSMVPNWNDVRQFFQHLRWFLFLGPQPKFGRWTYWEKFDYWAVFWGVAIIGTSGLIMAASPLLMAYLPGWVFNVALIIHSDEALLAASFLFAIHFFHVHLRPLKFPVDHVMFTGSLAEREMREERALELEQLIAEGRLEQVKADAPDRGQLIVNRVIAGISLVIGLGLLVAIVWSELIARCI